MIDLVEYTYLMVNMSKKCNLDCRLCYVDKSINFNELDEIDLIGFIDKYKNYIIENYQVNTNIGFCGHGELFAKQGFGNFLNTVNTDNTGWINIVTNGTINKLDEIDRFDNMTFTLSLDLPEQFCDWNRGSGVYRKILSFIDSLRKSGIPWVGIQTIVTKTNYRYIIEEGVDFSLNELKVDDIYLIPLCHSSIKRKGAFYIKDYNQDRLCLSTEQLDELSQRYPKHISYKSTDYMPRYMTLYSNGVIYNCSDSMVSIGKYLDPMESLFRNLINSEHCGYCSTVYDDVPNGSCF